MYAHREFWVIWNAWIWLVIASCSSSSHLGYISCMLYCISGHTDYITVIHLELSCIKYFFFVVEVQKWKILVFKPVMYSGLIFRFWFLILRFSGWVLGTFWHEFYVDGDMLNAYGEYNERLISLCQQDEPLSDVVLSVPMNFLFLVKMQMWLIRDVCYLIFTVWCSYFLERKKRSWLTGTHVVVRVGRLTCLLASRWFHCVVRSHVVHTLKMVINAWKIPE